MRYGVLEEISIPAQEGEGVICTGMGGVEEEVVVVVMHMVVTHDHITPK